MNLTLLPVIVVAFLVAAIAFAAFVAKGRALQGAAKPEVYYLKKSLFSPAERSFVGVLEALDYEGVTIASKVRLADIFGVKKGLERGERQRALNRISAKHVDFLLIQSSDGRALLGVELDDSSHEEEERVVRDSLVDSVFASAGLPILHVTAKVAYDPKELHRQIEAVLAKKA
jgi:very-short-patch-repair endonuclease